MVQKSALAVFGPSSTIDESGPETLILEASQQAVSSLSQSWNRKQFAGATKAQVAPKQIEIELGFSDEGEMPFQNIATPDSAIPEQCKSRSEFPSNLALEAAQPIADELPPSELLVAGEVEERKETPLDERAPNQAIANLNSMTAKSNDLSLKNKCRQKFLN